MLPPSKRIPPLHLYRQLLREASYLPPSCRPYIHSQITTRFRKHAKDPPNLIKLTQYRLQKAQANLRSLRAANAGKLDVITHILQLAHGRIGRRRRVLISQLLGGHYSSKTTQQQKEPSPFTLNVPVSRTAQRSPNLQKVRHRTWISELPPPTQPDWLEGWDLPALHALAASQVAHGGIGSHFTTFKDKGSLAPTEAAIPKLNIWGKPLTPRLARTKLRKWYVDFVNRIMPPVPKAEWEVIGAIATGKATCKMGERRARAETLDGSDDERTGTSWDWRLYATTPVRSLERQQSRNMKAYSGEQGTAPYGLGPAIGLSSTDRTRLWQRLYMSLWECTPYMEENAAAAPDEKDQERKWTIRWGGQKKRVQLARASQMAFLNSVPEGVVTAPKASKKLRRSQRL